MIEYVDDHNCAPEGVENLRVIVTPFQAVRIVCERSGLSSISFRY